MQCVIATQAGPVGRRSEFAYRRLQRPRKRVPVQYDYPVGLATTYLHRETMNLHREIQRLNPLGRHPRGILARHIVELGAIFDRDRLRPLRLPTSPRVILGQCGRAAHRLAVQIIVVQMQAVLVAAETPPQGVMGYSGVSW